MRVAFFVTEMTAPAVRFRVLAYKPYLDAAGIETLILPCEPGFYAAPRWKTRIAYHALNLKKVASRLKGIRVAASCDVAVLQREMVPYNTAFLELKLARLPGTALMLDWDDAVHLNYPNPDSPKSKMAKICSAADLVTCGSGMLRDFALQYNHEVEMLPTPVEPDAMFDPSKCAQRAPASDKFVVGWTGSTGTLHCIRGLAEPLRIVQERNPSIVVRIMSNWQDGSAGPDLGFKHEFVRWSPERESETVRSFSCGLMPLEDTPWNRGKCSLKILQYFASGVPAIASPVGNNLDVIKPGTNGLFATTTGEWTTAIERLLNAADKGQSLGLNGYRTLREQYSTAVCAERLIRLLKRASELNIQKATAEPLPR